MHLLVPNLRPRFCNVKTKNVQNSHGGFLIYAMYHHTGTILDSQKVRAKENLMLSHGGHSHRQTSDYNLIVNPITVIAFSHFNCMTLNKASNSTMTLSVIKCPMFVFGSVLRGST